MNKVTLAAIGLATSFLVTPAVYGGPITMIDRGPSSNRVDVVFLGDGYTSADISGGAYANHINSYVNYMFSSGSNQDPFYRYRNFFNVYRIDVTSNQSGADVPPLSIFRDTALDASYYFDGATERLLYVSEAKANAVLNAGLAGVPFTAEMRFITVNDTRYGGGGGSYAVYAGGTSSVFEIALHENGHSFSNLADEYGGIAQAYTGAEPSGINVTKDPTGAKWSRWLGYNQPGIGVIGAYEGAGYYDKGLYRPSLDSKMRSLGEPFDTVGREKIILDIYKVVNPLDSWLSNNTTLVNPAFLSVATIDPEVITVQWLVNNVLVAGATGETFNLLDFGYGPGTYSVMAHAFDPTGFDQINGWVRMNTSSLEETINWTIQIAAVPEPSTLMLFSIGVMASLCVLLSQRR